MYVVRMICLVFQVAMLKFNVIGANSLDGINNHLGLSKDQLSQLKSEPRMAFTREIKEHPNKTLMHALKNAEFNNDHPTISWHDAINNSLSNFKEFCATQNGTIIFRINAERMVLWPSCSSAGMIVIDLSCSLPDVSPPQMYHRGIIYLDTWTRKGICRSNIKFMIRLLLTQKSRNKVFRESAAM